MASFQAKIFWKMPRKRENKNYRFVPFLSGEEQKIPKKKAKKLKNTIVEKFKAKIVWKRPRKRQNKNYRFVSFRSYPTRNRKCPKKSKEIKKIKKFHYGIISSQNSLEKAKKERK